MEGRTVLGLLLLAAVGGATASRELLVSTTSTSAPPVTVNYSLPIEYADNGPLGFIPDPPLTDPLLEKTVMGANPEQVHVTLWGTGALLFSWATGDATVGPTVTPDDPQNTASWVFWGTKPGQYTQNASSADALVYTYRYRNESLHQLSYASPVLHHVLVTDLTPGETIYYVVGDPDQGALSSEFNITVPPEPTTSNLPFKVGIIADLGQTLNSSDTLKHLAANKPQLVWLVGDLCYADQYLTNGSHLAFSTPYPYDYHSFQPRWDAWGRLIEPLAATVPWNLVQGNHEIEPQLYPDSSLGATFTAFNARYPVPQDPASVVTTPALALFEPKLQNYRPEAGMAGAPADPNGYYSQDLPGMHVIWLNAHIPFDQNSLQYKWFMSDIQAVDRSRTPWLVVNVHHPLYSSYVASFKANEWMRVIYEPIFYEHGVDLVFSGHVHSYERTKPTYNYTVDECGPVHIIVGDGGNLEGVASTFIDQSPPAYCKNTSLYSEPWFQWTPEGKPLITLQDGMFCPTSQPAWSAYREPSFGHGILTIQNATHAQFEWMHNQGPAAQATDNVTLIRQTDRSSCRAVAPAPAPAPGGAPAGQAADPKGRKL